MPTQSEVRQSLARLEAELANAEAHARSLKDDDRARLGRLRERASMVRDEVGKSPEKKPGESEDASE